MKGCSVASRERLGLSAALLGDPELLILDEPTSGLDSEFDHRLRDGPRGLSPQEHMVLISRRTSPYEAPSRAPS